MFLIILNIAFAKELLNITTKIFNVENSLSDQIDVIQGSLIKIKDFDIAEYAINVELIGNNTHPWDVCFSKQGSIQFAEYENHHKIIFNATHNPDEEHANDPSYYLSTPIMVNMAITRKGLLIVTSDHTLLNYEVKQNASSQTGFSTNLLSQIDYDDFRSGATEAEVPQIVYANNIEYFYIIYKEQVIGGKLEDKIQLRNISIPGLGLENDNNFIGTIKIYDNYMFVPIGKDGLDIYSILPDGDLRHYQTITSQDFYNKQIPINIVDMVFAAQNETNAYLYVLDEIRGVIRYSVVFTEKNVILNRDDDFGFIDLKGGFSIQYIPNTSLLILKQVGINQQLVEIGLQEKNWFYVKIHYLTGQYFDIQISTQFIFLRGRDEHRIVRGLVYDEFEPEFVFYTQDDYFTEKANSFYEEYVFIPKLQSVVFYNDNYYVGQDPSRWSFNQSYPFLLGLTQHTLVELPYISQQPYVYCWPRSDLDVGNIYKYEILMNATNCDEKEKYIKENENVPTQTLLCSYKDSFSVKVVLAQAQIYNTQELLGVIIGLVILLILLAFLLAYLYKKFKSKEERLTSSVQGFDNNRGYDLEPNEGPNVQGL